MMILVCSFNKQHFQTFDPVGLNPTYLIVMEFCEKGNLRHVLDSPSKLPWDRKTRMCLDAAQGLYRYQPEVKHLHSLSALLFLRWCLQLGPVLIPACRFFLQYKICSVDPYKLLMSVSPTADCISQKRSLRCMVASLAASF